MSLKEVLDTYDDIDLSEDELQEAVLWRKQKKSDELKAAELKRQQEENRKQLTETKWSYEQTSSFMKYRGNQIFEHGFNLDGNNQTVFDLLCYYFSGDIKFTAFADSLGIKNPSLNKGIMLAGNFGVGKTTLMKLFMKNQRQVYHLLNAKKIADLYEKNGEECLEQFLIKHKNAYNDPAVFFQPYSGLCIDDIGTEDIKTNYGNKRNVIGDIIELRYDKQNTGIFLHATTNLSSVQLNELYGGRVISRMREILNFIELSGNDRRK